MGIFDLPRVHHAARIQRADVTCRCRVDSVQLQWGSALATGLAAKLVVAASVHRTKARPRGPRCSTAIRSNRLSSNNSSRNSNRRPRLRSSRSNSNVRRPDPWADRRRTTVACAGAVAVVARGIIDHCRLALRTSMRLNLSTRKLNQWQNSIFLSTSCYFSRYYYII